MLKISYDIKNYRKDILELVKENDKIIELGCHVGNTTKLLIDKCKVIAIDNSPEAIPKMKNLENENKNLKFISGDVRLHDVIANVFEITQKCDVLAIDLGGGYHPDTVFKVFYIWSSTFKPKHTVIRNKGLLEFCTIAKLSNEDYKSDYGFLQTCLDQGIPPQIKEFELWTPSLYEKK